MAKNISSDLGSQSVNLQFQKGSEFLETQKDELVDIWKGRKIISYYERPTVRPHAADSHQSHANERNGEPAEVVEAVSAQLYLPDEERIPVRCNYSDMVKFLSPSDTTYGSVANQIQREVARVWVERSMYFDECPSIIILTMFL